MKSEFYVMHKLWTASSIWKDEVQFQVQTKVLIS
jgi:hypothetical protein